MAENLADVADRIAESRIINSVEKVNVDGVATTYVDFMTDTVISTPTISWANVEDFGGWMPVSVEFGVGDGDVRVWFQKR